MAQGMVAYDLVVVDMNGHKQVLGGLPGTVFAPRVSPDGKQVAFELRDPSPRPATAPERLWVAELAHLDRRRSLPMVGNGRNWAPLWSHDGQRLVAIDADDNITREIIGVTEPSHVSSGAR
jgi:Tol biopolymer transport system component